MTRRQRRSSRKAPDLSAGLAAPVASVPADGAAIAGLPDRTFYGHPHDPGMGIVGEHEIEQLARDDSARRPRTTPPPIPRDR